MRDTALVVMAAGIGSRFGKGIKQLAPVGPSGELIMDYSVFDAKSAGFDRVVFIIRKEIENEFHERIGRRLSKLLPMEYVFQETEDIPEEFSGRFRRTKPWGTGQAVLCCKDTVKEPFMVINADDYYGRDPFATVHDYLVKQEKDISGIEKICMAGYHMENTLSENGGVTRGICVLDEKGKLAGIDETRNIVKTKEGAAVLCGGNKRALPGGLLVSMNMWGFGGSFMKLLESGFYEFLSGLESDDNSTEYLLPVYIDSLLHDGRAEVEVLKTAESWFGVTYKEDREKAEKEIRKLIDAGIYSERLYG